MSHKDEARAVLADMEAIGCHPYINAYSSIVHPQSMPAALFRRSIDCGQSMFEVIKEKQDGKRS
jgi:hypothetical protein